MIEVTSRRMECTFLTPDYSQMFAVALQDKPKGCFTLNPVTVTLRLRLRYGNSCCYAPFLLNGTSVNSANWLSTGVAFWFQFI